MNIFIGNSLLTGASAIIKDLMKRSVYLDTTIFSYYVDERPILQVHIDRTKEWWINERNLYELYISLPTLVELQEGKFKGQEEALNLAKSITLLHVDPEINDIINVYIKNKLMPSTDVGDALHLAYSSFYKIDILLTWNCRHLANVNKKGHIRSINQSLGLFVPEITTPLELRME